MPKKGEKTKFDGSERMDRNKSQAAYDRELAAENKKADAAFEGRREELHEKARKAIIGGASGERPAKSLKKFEDSPAGRLTILAQLAEAGITKDLVVDAMNEMHKVVLDPDESTHNKISAAKAIVGTLGKWFGLEADPESKKDHYTNINLIGFSDVKMKDGSTVQLHATRETAEDAQDVRDGTLCD